MSLRILVALSLLALPAWFLVAAGLPVEFPVPASADDEKKAADPEAAETADDASPGAVTILYTIRNLGYVEPCG